MAVRETSVEVIKARVGVDPTRPEYDWNDNWETLSGDKQTWFYPWQGFELYRELPRQGLAERWVERGLAGYINPRRHVRPTSALRARTFTDLFYGRMQINPALLALGNVLNDQTRTVEIWNATFEPTVLTGMAREETDGIDLDIALPRPLAPLEAITIQVGVTTTGPANIDATFSFEAENLPATSLRVTGTRTVVFSLLPDTSKDYIEKLAWVSSVFTSHDGTEQRMALTESPDTVISFTVSSHDAQIHYLDSLLWGWQHRIYALPLWHRASRAKAPAFAETFTIQCDTEHAGFRVGGMGILWGSFDRFETFEVDGILPGQLTLRRPLGANWPPRTPVMACRPARLPVEVGSSWQHGNLGSAALSFVFTEVEQEEPEDSATTYRGHPLLVKAPNWVAPKEEKNTRNIEVFESALKARFTVMNNDVPSVVSQHSWWLKGLDNHMAFRRWLFARRGRVVPFWAPSWKADLILAADTEPGQSQITVKAIGYRNFYASRAGREDLMIFLKNGQYLIRRVSNAAAGPDSKTEIVRVAQEFTAGLKVSDVKMICFLGLHRLDADEVEIDWRSDNLALCNQNMRLLTDGNI